MKLIFFTLSLTIAGGLGLELPSSFQRCKVSPELDSKPNECLREAVQDAIKFLCDNDGLKEFGMGDLDPFEINNITFTTSTGPLSVALNVSDGKLFGISNMKIIAINGKFSSAKDFQMSIKYKMDKAVVSGIYDVSGRILVLPIVGRGFGNITFVKFGGEFTLFGQPKVKNGKEYIKITDFKSEFGVENLKFYLENLFNGNQQLNQALNNILNENWEEFYEVVKPTTIKVFGTFFQKYAKKMVEKVAFEDLFIIS